MCIPQASMISKKITNYTPNASFVPVPTAVKAGPTKCYPTLYIRSTVSNPLDQYSTTVLVYVPSNTPIPYATNPPIEPTEEFKTIVSYITESFPFPIAPILYEPKTFLLQLEYLKQDLIGDASTYKSAVYHSKKSLLLAINVPLKILTVHLQNHQTQSSTSLNLNPDIKAEATIKTHRFQKYKNHMTDIVPPPTPGGSHTTAYSHDVVSQTR